MSMKLNHKARSYRADVQIGDSSERSTNTEALSQTELCEHTEPSSQQEMPLEKAPKGLSDCEKEHPLL